MTEEAFQKSMRRIADASPFKGAPILKMEGRVINLPRMEMVTGTNKAQHDEYGTNFVRTISIHVPKELIEKAPTMGVDAISYKGRDYKIVNVDGGEDDCSAFWLIEGEAPL